MLASPPEEKVDMQEFETGGGGYLLRNCIATPSQMQLANIAKAIVGEKNIIIQNIIQVVFHPAWQSRFYEYK